MDRNNILGIALAVFVALVIAYLLASRADRESDPANLIGDYAVSLVPASSIGSCKGNSPGICVNQDSHNLGSLDLMFGALSKRWATCGEAREWQSKGARSVSFIPSCYRSPTPTPIGWRQPTRVPTPTQTVVPTVVPTPTHTVVPTISPVPMPIQTVAPTIAPAPTVTPTAIAVPVPTAIPIPTLMPTSTPDPSIIYGCHTHNIGRSGWEIWANHDGYLHGESASSEELCGDRAVYHDLEATAQAQADMNEW